MGGYLITLYLLAEVPVEGLHGERFPFNLETLFKDFQQLRIQELLNRIELGDEFMLLLLIKLLQAIGQSKSIVS